MRHYPVVVVGGGITGIGILRDLSMRGIKALLVEQRDLAHGASSRFHGLLHSGARYSVGDPASAEECIIENMILRKIAPHSIEFTEGFFVRTAEDDPSFEEKWVTASEKAGIEAKPISVKDALGLEPNLDPSIKSVYRVPDSAIDGFRIVWQNAKSAKRYGGELQNYAEVVQVHSQNGVVNGVTIKDRFTGKTEQISCDFLVSAAGSWAGKVAALAGLTVKVKPSRGLLLAYNHRFTERIINRLRKSGDGDIFVPHGSITLFGTTSVNVDEPDDHTITTEETLKLIDMGKKLFPKLDDYRLLRGFAGTRPLYTANDADSGRAASRGFAVIDHEKEGMKQFATIVGGKFTTYRLMAEKITDLVASKMGNTTKCRTAEEPLIQELDNDIVKRATKFFPPMGLNLSISRQGDDFARVVHKMEEDNDKRVLLCECELLTQAEFEVVAGEPTSRSIADVRRRTRMGMGTCQGTFCAFRAIGTATTDGTLSELPPKETLKRFVEERWFGIRPMLWGSQMKEMELNRGIYGTLLNVDGVAYEE